MPFSPNSQSGRTMTKQLETMLEPGAVPTIWKPARSTLPVAFTAPATMPSARPCATSMAPKKRGSSMAAAASSLARPLCLRLSW